MDLINNKSIYISGTITLTTISTLRRSIEILNGTLVEELNKSTDIIVVCKDGDPSDLIFANQHNVQFIEERKFIEKYIDLSELISYYYTYVFSNKNTYKRKTIKKSVNAKEFSRLKLDNKNFYVNYETDPNKTFDHRFINRKIGSAWIQFRYELLYKNDRLITLFEKLIADHPEVISDIEECYYNPIKIRKKSKKGLMNNYRTIIEPKPFLKKFQKEFKKIIEFDYLLMPHEASSAYHYGDSVVKNAKRHKNSKYFLKVDIKDFFNSISKQFLETQLKKLYQFCTIDNQDIINIKTREKHGNLIHNKFVVENNDYVYNSDDFLFQSSKEYSVPTTKKLLDIILKTALYKNSLPQGSPLSPVLANLAMIPLDDEIFSYCKYVDENKPFMTYSRYSDDIVISSYKYFKPKKVLEKLEEILLATPLKLNYNKISFKKYTQRLFITGVKINNNNEISYGHLKKAQLKRDLFKLLINIKNQSANNSERNSMIGKLSYARSIDKVGIDRVIDHYSNKFNIPKNKFFHHLKSN